MSVTLRLVRFFECFVIGAQATSFFLSVQGPIRDKKTFAVFGEGFHFHGRRQRARIKQGCYTIYQSIVMPYRQAFDFNVFREIGRIP